MFTSLLMGVFPVVITVVMHAAGVAVLIRALLRMHSFTAWGFWEVMRIVIGLTVCLILIHLTEIAVWGLFYFWQGCMPDVKTSIYFSAVTYTGVGDAHLALPESWRELAPLEGLTAILMCGLSTGIFFAIVSHWISNWKQRKTAPELKAAAPINN